MAATLKPDSDGAERLASSTIRRPSRLLPASFYMNKEVYIRPLRLEDAQMSYQWRNSPKIWRHTLSKPDRHITVEMEAESLARILARQDEKRFAICLSENRAYIGNISVRRAWPLSRNGRKTAVMRCKVAATFPRVGLLSLF